MINNYKEERVCVYKGETYSVRDNGAVMRHIRQGKRARTLDNIWTFGKKNLNTGYMEIGTERVHRIVAIAFLGEPEIEGLIVDHIDTNRCNNRPENLRWITKLENALSNPITRKRIISVCGSIEAFLQNPSLLRSSSENKNYDWMRTVTPEEAKISKERLLEWAEEDKKSTGNGNLGEWVYENKKSQTIKQEELVTQSLTQNVVQINWRTPTEFPLCPQRPETHPLQEYLDNLKEGSVFATNDLWTSKVIKADFNTTRTALYVMTSSDSGVKGYALAKIEYDPNKQIFYHESRGTFFEEVGAEKYFTQERGYEWTGGDVFDDFC